MKLYPSDFYILFFRHLIITIIFLFCSNQAFAIMPFIIKNIRIEGTEHIDAKTIFSYLPVHIGDVFINNKGIKVIKMLYATGFFKDIQVKVKNDILIVYVTERPVITHINFLGTKEFNQEKLTKILQEIGISKLHVFNKFQVYLAIQEIKKQYLSRGFFNIKIKSTITPIKNNCVIVTFTINEGIVSRIRQISFVGNKIFSDDILRAQLKLNVVNWLTWYTKSDQYSKQKFMNDIETLRFYYLDRGYLKMQVESTQILISPNKENIFIIININEGDKFIVSNITIYGKTFGIEKNFFSLMQLQKYDTYSNIKLTNSIQKMNEQLGNLGYAFSNISVKKIINYNSKEVVLNIILDPGKKIYIRHINITGNKITRDEVIRREFRQLESSWYNNKKIKLSHDRINRLGYFQDIQIEVPIVPNTLDQVDININVKEKETGSFMLGAGFSQQDRLSLTASISQDNAFGNGTMLGIDINTGSFYRTIAVSHTNPYFNKDGISRTYEMFLRTNRQTVFKTGNYHVSTLGGNLKFGIPFSEIDRVFFGISLENITVNTDSTSPSLYRAYVRDFNNKHITCDVINDNKCGTGSATTLSIPLTISWQRDNRNNSLIPTKGFLQRAHLELSAIGTLNYYRITYQQYQYFQLFQKNIPILAISGELNYGKGFSNKPYPIFKNFYAGGIGSVRGYEGSSLGDLRDQYGDSMGGSSRLIGNVELQFPFSGSTQDHSLYWFTFIDGGNVFTNSKSVTINNLRYSVGIGISWISPIGPLKLSYGKPLNFRPGDKLKNFQFQLGTVF